VSAIEIGAAGTVVKLAVERGAPAGLAIVRSWFTGKTLVVVGPPRAGKTTFVRYVQYGIFQHADKTPKTYDPTSSPRFNLRLGKDNNLEVLIKTAVDLPGHAAARTLADDVFKQRPHAIVIVLGLDNPLEGDEGTAAWLREFCKQFDYRWLQAQDRRNRLRSIIIVMNKLDLVDAPQLEAHENRYREVMGDEWRSARGPQTDDPTFRRCVMVENPDGTKWVDAVLVDMATSLKRKR